MRSLERASQVFLTGEAEMFEALFVLTLLALLYVDIIEFLEKCDHPHTWSVRSVYPESQETTRR